MKLFLRNIFSAPDILYESMGKNKEAIAMYQLIKDKYPASPRGFEIDRYLARLGVVK